MGMFSPPFVGALLTAQSDQTSNEVRAPAGLDLLKTRAGHRGRWPHSLRRASGPNRPLCAAIKRPRRWLDMIASIVLVERDVRMRLAQRHTNDTNSTAKRHRHDTDRTYRGCAAPRAASA